MFMRFPCPSSRVMSTSADSLFNYHGDLYLKSRRLRRSSQGSDDPIGLCWLRDNRQAAALREDSGPASILRCCTDATQFGVFRPSMEPATPVLRLSGDTASKLNR